MATLSAIPQDNLGNTPGNPANTDHSTDLIFQRLVDEQTWYSQKSSAARTAFKRIKVCEIVAAAMIPFLTGYPWPGVTYVVGGLGVLITILEGILHLNQYQENWTNYRNTAESLKHEKFLYLAKAGPYSGATDARAMLAERVEALISQENSQWVAALQKSNQSGQGAAQAK
jgi:Protein of unknown function (DUF4231)